MTWVSNKNKQGFTIVELLIVIVVIAILAAVTIVSYTGIQNRAKNQQTVSAVRAYYSALTSYALKNGTLPSSRSCLGPESFYTSNPCYIGASTYTWNSTLNDSLNEFISTRPSTAPGVVSSSSITASGIFYDNQSGASAGGYIGFPIFGESSCPVVAGAQQQTTSTLGSNVYCRITTPTY